MKLQNYDNTAIGIIKGAEILDAVDLKVVEVLKDELKDVFIHSQLFRTRTEMEVSVLQDIKHPTPDSKYWQCVREQNVMFQNLVNLSYDYRKNKVEIEKLKIAFKKQKDKLEKELIQIEIERKEFLAKIQEREAKDRIREIGEWHHIKQQLIPQLKHGTVDVNEHQIEAFSKRFAVEAALAEKKGTFPEQRNALGLHATTEKAISEGRVLSSRKPLEILEGKK